MKKFDGQSLDNLPALAQKIISLLQKTSPFIVRLEGEIGAGKTTLVRHVLWEIGLPKESPVLSPTFTYMNEYRIGNEWYAHLDFFRAGPNLLIEEIGVLDAKKFAGVFVEWPDTIQNSSTLDFTHQIKIDFSADRLTRNYAIARSVSDEAISLSNLGPQ